jgi:hypothetical protein
MARVERCFARAMVIVPALWRGGNSFTPFSELLPLAKPLGPR